MPSFPPKGKKPSYNDQVAWESHIRDLTTGDIKPEAVAGPVAAAIAESPAVVDAAAVAAVTAVDDEIGARDLIEAQPLENELEAAGGYLLSDGQITFMVPGTDGKPITPAARLIADKLGAMGFAPVDVENTDLAAGGILLSNGQVTHTVFGLDGKPIPAAAELIAEALVDGGHLTSSVNGAKGALTITAGPNIEVETSGDTITIGNAGADLFAPMDIWRAFGDTGIHADFPSDDYATLISGIDGAVGSAATRESIGVSANGITNIYAYTAGTPGKPHALVIGGTHPRELMGWRAPLRFFLEFCTNPHPVMVALRSRLHLTYIPILNSGGFRTELGDTGLRENPNDVDLNRNFPFFWPYYDRTDNQGTAALSEPESQALKDLLDATDIACVLDLHGGGYTSITYYPPSANIPVGQRATYAALEMWRQVYQQPDETIEPWVIDQDTEPMIRNWAPKYLRWHKGYRNAFATTLEGGGYFSVPGEMSARDARIYCGLIHMYLAAWLTYGQAPDLIPPYTLTAQRTTQQTSTALGSGGSQISSSTAAPVAMDTYPGQGESTAKRTYIDIPLRAPGHFTVTASAVLEAGSGATGSTEVEMAIGWARSPAEGGNVAALTDTQHLAWASVGTAGSHATLARSWYLPDTLGIEDDDPLYRLQLYLRLSSGTGPVLLRSATLTVTHHPEVDTDRIPAFARES